MAFQSESNFQQSIAWSLSAIMKIWIITKKKIPGSHDDIEGRLWVGVTLLLDVKNGQ